jgi:hypothetical protein
LQEYAVATNTPTVDKLIALARGEVGYHEGRSGGHWNNKEKYSPQIPGLEWVSAGGYAWCAVFVYWVAFKGGVGSLFCKTADCDTAGRFFKSQGRWSEYPAVGAQVFFGTPSDLNHTGFVVAFNDNTVTTVEGNTNSDGSREGDGVYLKVHPRTSSRIVGYGYPKYAEGIVSADPRFASEAPKSTPPASPSTAQKIKDAIKDLRASKKDLQAAQKPGAVAKVKKLIDTLRRDR